MRRLMRCSGGSELELEKTTTGLNRTVESSAEMLHQVANTINAGFSSGHHNKPSVWQVERPKR
jgi:hypothetical protein